MRSLSKTERAFAALTGSVVALVVCAFAAVAQAEPPALIPYGHFGTHEFGGSGIALDGSGNLFMSSLASSSFGPSSVVKLDLSGNLISPPSPFGSAHYSGIAVNPTNGHVYVLGEAGFFQPLKISVFNPDTGALLSSFEVPASRNIRRFITDIQIAADSAGNVYVPFVRENEVLEYSEAGTLLETFKGSGTDALKEPVGVAVDQSTGNLWIADAGNSRIVELESTGAPVEVNGKPVEIRSEGVVSVALDRKGHVFAMVDNSADPCGEKASPCLHLIEYGGEGKQLADVGAGQFGGTNSGETERLYSGVAASGASGRVYALAGSQETVWVFGPPTVPIVERELTAETGASEVKLGAMVNPGGLAASYRFQYGTTTEYGNTAPSPDGAVGEGITARAVWASASGLAPGTTYHYRVVASNELGTVYGPDQTFTTLTAKEAECSNEAFRSGFGANLPDCRAYELVTPPPENSSQFDAKQEVAFSGMVAADGDAITLDTAEPQPEAPSAGEQYVARRGAGGWVAEDIMPLGSYDGVLCPGDQYVYAYSEQLTKDLMEIGKGSSPSAVESPESCNPEGRQVVSGEPVGYENLLVRDNALGTYQLVNNLNAAPTGVKPSDAHFQAASADLSHVIFTETAVLTEGAQYGVENLYEWDEGTLRLVSVLPDGTAVPGSLAAKVGTTQHDGVISSDGSRVLFTYGGALYDRIDGQRTVQIDESQGGSGGSGGGVLQASTSDGSKVFFLDGSRLTKNSTAEAGEPDLYECALAEGASRCVLTDLTAIAGGEHADVLDVIPLGGHDSSYVYFVAKGVLAEGAKSGKPNLYLWNGEDTTFIATLSGGDSNGGIGYGETSPDGRWLAFLSYNSLTGYDNVGTDGKPAKELFLYSAATGQLVCASCNPTGEPPVAEGGIARIGGGIGQYPNGVEAFYGSEVRRPHLLTDAGRLFFETRDALVPSDTNGQSDVYEYEGGRVYLISSGTSSFESNVEGASESGSDVFFRSNQALVPQDNREGMIVIYDARAYGGFPAAASPPSCTTADACRTPVSPQPSIYGSPSSQTFSGVGNVMSKAIANIGSKRLTRTQKLKRALGSCRKRYRRAKKKRARCERSARKAFGNRVKKHNVRFHRRGK